jgi:hypothetical protein
MLPTPSWRDLLFLMPRFLSLLYLPPAIHSMNAFLFFSPSNTDPEPAMIMPCIIDKRWFS